MLTGPMSPFVLLQKNMVWTVSVHIMCVLYRVFSDHYCQPQFKYRIGDTYGTTADLTLVNPAVNEQSNVIVSTRQLDDTQVNSLQWPVWVLK